MSDVKKVALGLSGGVDSAVCAYLLKEQGYQVSGVYIECWNEPGCRAEQDRKDALQIALSLNIPFKVLDYTQEYSKRVMQYFLDEYQAGRTPNPDVLCNTEIKFGLFYEWAIHMQKFNYIATGHYAQIASKDTKNYLLAGIDQKKDQTYFLHRIEQEHLEHVLFPIGNMTKLQVRDEAKKRSIPVAKKKDSVGICFVGDINVRSFLKERLGEKPGLVVDLQGNKIGTHNGLWFFTIGQRQGFSVDAKLVKENSALINSNEGLPPLYVVGKNTSKNLLIVGKKSDTLRITFLIEDLHLISSSLKDFLSEKKLLVKIRHTGKLVACKLLSSPKANKIDSSNKKIYTVILSKPVEGVAEGQSAVFYTQKNKSTICLGGGTIILSPDL